MLKNASIVLMLATLSLWFFKTFFKDSSLPNISYETQVIYLQGSRIP